MGIQLLHESISLVLTSMLSALFAVTSFLLMKITKRRNRTLETDFKKKICEQESEDSEIAVSRIQPNIPIEPINEYSLNGIVKEESEIRYVQIKHDDCNADYIEISSLLREHHQQAILQSSIQFWFSLSAAVVGLVFIITMVLINNSSNMQWYEYILRVLPGTIIDTVSVLFFKQARETRERATEFFKELNYQQQISRSLDIANTIDNTFTQSFVKSRIALHIIGIDDDVPKDDR